MRKKTPYEVRRDLKTKEFWSRLRRSGGDGETHLIAEVDNNPTDEAPALNPHCASRRKLIVDNNGWDWELLLESTLDQLRELNCECP